MAPQLTERDSFMDRRAEGTVRRSRTRPRDGARRRTGMTPIMVVMVRPLLLALAASAVVLASSASGQTPQPFPRPGATQQTPRPEPQAPRAPAAAPSQGTPNDPNAPTEATLGFPVYPSAQFIASYDAGRGQRYYIFGATAPYADLVVY